MIDKSLLKENGNLKDIFLSIVNLFLNVILSKLLLILSNKKKIKRILCYLTQKLKSSTAMLEQHLLKRASLPLSMVRTNAEQLHYLDNPETVVTSSSLHANDNRFLERFGSYPVNYGY